jgi:uncharacterized membrane protein YgcG
MARLMKCFLLIFVAGACATSPARDDSTERNFVFDRAFMLNGDRIDSLNSLINDLEEKVGSQIMIWTQSSLDGASIDSVSLQTASDLGVGRASHNDGVLIFIAEAERQARIEVGLGLENIIPDETAARLLREDLAPNFRSGKYGLGLYLVVEKISRLIQDNSNLVGSKPQYRQRFDSIRSNAKNVNDSLSLHCATIRDTLTNKKIYRNVDTNPTIDGDLSSLMGEIGKMKISKDPDID